MWNILHDELSERGYKARIMSIDHLGQLKCDIENICIEGGMSDSFSYFIQGFFDFNIPENFSDARSIIIVAVHSPSVRVFFNYKGKRIPLFIPPTYIDISSISGKIKKLLKELPDLRNYNLMKARLPEKLLAVRSGLGAYGRNNICYVPEMGSFVQLASFFSDIPCLEDNWNAVKLMDSCKNCLICSKKCPTGSIMEERIIINAEKCICHLNECVGVFPDWVDASWHNSIVGCFLCQEACPQNKDLLEQVIDMGEFSHEETELLLNKEPLEGIHASTKAKLEQLDMLVYYDCLPRNLKVLLDKAG